MECKIVFKGTEATICTNKIREEMAGCEFDSEPSVTASYREFVTFFERVGKVESHEFIIAASFAYSWMPTTLRFKSLGRVDELAAILERARHWDLGESEISSLKQSINRSVVGTSKLLHFANPERYPIYDSWIDWYLYGRESQTRITSVEHYLSYVSACRCAVATDEFNSIREYVQLRLDYEGFQISRLRALELIMFLTAKGRGRK